MVNDEMPLSIGKGILFFIQFLLRTYLKDRQRQPTRGFGCIRQFKLKTKNQPSFQMSSEETIYRKLYFWFF